MADKSFGLKQVNLIGASGTPRIESPNNLNINATNVAISTNMSVGGQITVGDSFIKSGAVGLGTTTTTGRNAGVSTATGTLIYNSTTNAVEVWNGSAWNTLSNIFTATGGDVSAFETDGSKYHIFTTSGTFTATASNDIEILMIAGGGGGGSQHGGGGGAGALYFNTSLPIISGDYTVTVGTGGIGGRTSNLDGSANGLDSVFGPGTSSHIVVNGGGRGRKMAAPNVTPMPGGPGGCGGGGGMTPVHPSPPVRQAGGTVTAPPTHPLPSPFIFGAVGGEGTDYNAGPNAGSGGGGGGCDPSTGGPPTNTVPNTNGTASQGGGDFICPTAFLPGTAISALAAELGTPTVFLGVPIPSPDNQKRAFGGGGAGGSHSPWGVYNPGGRYPNNQGGGSANRTGGEGGLGNTGVGYPGVDGRGGGGGGSGAAPADAGDGGDGVVIIKYSV